MRKTQRILVSLTRVALVLLLCLAVAVPLQANPAPFASSSATLLLKGQINLNGNPATYILEGWTLLHPNLEPYIGQAVVVSGRPMTEPNIYMRPVLQVETIRPLDGALPPVSLPAFPVLTAPSVQWGRVRTDGAQFWLETPAAVLPLTGGALRNLVGRPAALQLDRMDGNGRYPVLEAVALDQDLAGVLGRSQIFQRPEPATNLRIWSKPLELDRPLILGNSRSLAGLRQIAETVGAEVSWDDATKSATFHLNDRTVRVTIGSPVAEYWDAKDAQSYLLDVAPVILQDRTMLPVRFLAEALNLRVIWDPATHTIDLR
jgi:hypothetical protein